MSGLAGKGKSVGDPKLAIRAAEAPDLHFIVAAERLPGYEQLVGRSTPAQHEAFLTDGQHGYFIAERDGEPVGFVIVRGWNASDGVSLVKRVVVTEPGRGMGRAMLAAVIDLVFTTTETHRLEIGLFPTNARARRCYEASGFLPEGIARGRVFLGGTHHDELVMSILRSDWEAKDGRPK
jgi:RimJ/RimL family protein N-acetyltransferase